MTGIAIDDPDSLLKWLAKDRAALVFGGLMDFRAREATFQDLIRSWIRHVRAAPVQVNTLLVE